MLSGCVLGGGGCARSSGGGLDLTLLLVVVLLVVSVGLSGEQEPLVACLWDWRRLLYGWTSLTVPRSKRQQHLQVLFISGHGTRRRYVRSRSENIQFFLRDLGGSTSVVQCVDTDTINEAVGFMHGDIYMSQGSRVVSIHGTLLRNGIKRNFTVTLHHRLCGGSDIVDVPGQWQCSLSLLWHAVLACKAVVLSVRSRRVDAPTPAPWSGKQRGPLGRYPPVQKGNVPPTTSSEQYKVVPPKQSPPGAGVGGHHLPFWRTRRCPVRI